MFEIVEFKEMIIGIITQGSSIAILLAVSERAVNMMISFISGSERVRF